MAKVAKLRQKRGQSFRNKTTCLFFYLRPRGNCKIFKEFLYEKSAKQTIEANFSHESLKCLETWEIRFNRILNKTTRKEGKWLFLPTFDREWFNMYIRQIIIKIPCYIALFSAILIKSTVLLFYVPVIERIIAYHICPALFMSVKQ